MDYKNKYDYKREYSKEEKELKRYIIDRAKYLEIIENDGYSKLRLLKKN